ncbi:hypothetical protein TW95_gp0712 [Pandoravirus inopinatum]|uniref:Uncharacterized protein n=1 Tax=Pandoravirus inopinatum TaxID=1605721 RepID=A0A0B5J9B0_9VIRU|nr:hypothetical protein TW95_gp0712 [Pandoravirus inopinatum]AJF97446.1 hypothetical protein [Pandoravirus inopinatum]
MDNKTKAQWRQSRARRPRQTPQLDDPRVGLADMPMEIVDGIMHWLVRPVDICACARALAVSTGYSLARHTDLAVPTVLSTGAPLCVAMDFVARRHRAAGRMPFAWLLAAVQGGQADVVERMHESNHIRTLMHLDLWAGPYVVEHGLRNACAVKLALRAAIEGAHGPVLAWLLTRYRPDRHSRSKSALHALVPLVLKAPRHTTHDLLMAIHQATPHNSCACPERLVHAAKESDRIDMLDWMYTHRCAAIMGTPKHPGIDALFLWAVAYGHAVVMHWAWGKVDDPRRINNKAMCQAVSRAMVCNRATIVEFVCHLGLWVLPPDVAKYAQRQGFRVCIDNVPDLDQRRRRSKRARHQEPPCTNIIDLG